VAETLFIDARKLGALIDRTHRELSDEDVARVAGTYHAWRGDEGSGEYADVAGFCKAADCTGAPRAPPRRFGAHHPEEGIRRRNRRGRTWTRCRCCAAWRPASLHRGSTPSDTRACSRRRARGDRASRRSRLRRRSSPRRRSAPADCPRSGAVCASHGVGATLRSPGPGQRAAAAPSGWRDTAECAPAASARTGGCRANGACFAYAPLVARWADRVARLRMNTSQRSPVTSGVPRRTSAGPRSPPPRLGSRPRREWRVPRRSSGRVPTRALAERRIVLEVDLDEIPSRSRRQVSHEPRLADLRGAAKNQRFPSATH
jgi:hypothetical protein